MKIGSLFAGIGGLELGLESAGVGHTVWQVEQSPFCRAVLREHWGEGVEQFVDVRACGAHNLEPVDVICGGFPCQDISIAGLGAGLDGERSGLWRDFARIVCEMGPRYAVVENVAALTNRGLFAILGTLADRGYDAEWSCVQAIDVGAPHFRDRLFVIAYLANANRDTRQRCDGARIDERRRRSGARACADSGSSDGQAYADHARSSREALADADGGRCTRGRLEKSGRLESTRGDLAHGRSALWRFFHAERDKRAAASRLSQSSMGGSAHGISAWMDGWDNGLTELATDSPNRIARLRALGNAVVPQVAEVVGRKLLEIDHRLWSEEQC